MPDGPGDDPSGLEGEASADLGLLENESRRGCGTIMGADLL